MIKLIYEREGSSEYSAVNKVEMTLDDGANLDQMLEAYKEFLGAIGFYVKGELIVSDEE